MEKSSNITSKENKNLKTYQETISKHLLIKKQTHKFSLLILSYIPRAINQLKIFHNLLS
jgi:hypothetical protein